MLHPGATYRHISSLDLDMSIVQVTYRGPEYAKAKVLFTNRNCFLEENRLVSTQMRKVKIYYKDLWKWKDV